MILTKLGLSYKTSFFGDLIEKAVFLCLFMEKNKYITYVLRIHGQTGNIILSRTKLPLFLALENDDPKMLRTCTYILGSHLAFVQMQTPERILKRIYMYM